MRNVGHIIQISRNTVRDIQCHRFGRATCFVTSDDSLRSGGIYADSRGGGERGSILYLASEGCRPLGLPRSAMRTREVINRQHIAPLDVAALLCAISWTARNKK